MMITECRTNGKYPHHEREVLRGLQGIDCPGDGSRSKEFEDRALRVVFSDGNSVEYCLRSGVPRFRGHEPGAQPASCKRVQVLPPSRARIPDVDP
jgi:hypothetical protein